VFGGYQNTAAGDASAVAGMWNKASTVGSVVP
jgi:hypothetical protein